MKYSANIVFSEEGVDEFYSGASLSKLKKEFTVKKYSFKTKIELTAFLKGIDEAVGWLECAVIEPVLKKNQDKSKKTKKNAT